MPDVLVSWCLGAWRLGVLVVLVSWCLGVCLLDKVSCSGWLSGMSRTLPAVRLCPSLVLGAPGGFLACPAPCPRSGSARPLCWVLGAPGGWCGWWCGDAGCGDVGAVGGVAMLVVVMLVVVVLGCGRRCSGIR